MGKSRVTISLDERLLLTVDRYVRQAKVGSRSALIERVLQRWLEQEELKTLERDIEAYYQALSPSEREEDRRWAKASSRQAARLWDEKQR